jgi:hypothetical protein
METADAVMIFAKKSRSAMVVLTLKRPANAVIYLQKKSRFVTAALSFAVQPMQCEMAMTSW